MQKQISDGAIDGGAVAFGTATTLWGAYIEPALHGLLLFGSVCLVGLRILVLLRDLRRGRAGKEAM